jgi:radical SAM-linked protein
MERALRRSEVPVEYTQGFHPHLKLSFGPPLQLGYTSEAEYFDLVLIRPFNTEMAGRLNEAMPEGFYIIEARPNFFGKKVSLSSKLNRAVYEVAVDGDYDYRSLIEKLLAEAAVEIERVGKKETKTVDIRPAIYRLEYHDDPDGEGGVIHMELGVGSAGYVRPSEVMAVMEKSGDQALEAWRIHRKDMLYIDDEGRRLTPMEF